MTKREIFRQRTTLRTSLVGAGSGKRRPLRMDQLESREMLAANLNFVINSLGQSVPVDPKINNLLGSELAFIESDYLSWSKNRPVAQVSYQIPAATPNYKQLNLSAAGLVVETVAQPGKTDQLVNNLKNLGATVTGSYGKMVSAIVSPGMIDAMAALPELAHGRVSYKPVTNAGLVDDQAVQSLRSDIGSVQYGVTGSGITVGVLSDSFNNKGGYAADVASGDLPAGVKVLSDMTSGGTDEGRAMAQLVYDVAPGSSLAYHTAYNGEAGFAQGIINLAKPVAQGGAAAQVIVDDIAYLTEPFFQDGVISQAADQSVTQYGASYFSAAGNNARASYEAAFRSTSITTPTFASTWGLGATSNWHDFDSGAGLDIYQPIQLAAGEQLVLTYQWDQPFGSVSGPGSQSDVDIYLVNSTKTTAIAGSAADNMNGDPSEILTYTNSSASSTTVYLCMNYYGGTVTPTYAKYINFGGGTTLAYATNSGTSFGHPLATNAAGVGAARYSQTPAFGSNPAVKEYFTSAGGTPILFNTAGIRLASPQTRNQPRFVSIDGTNTTFFGSDYEGDGLPNFFGTSAAAPHAAAVAALMKQLKPTLTASQIYTTLQSTALDMGTAGFDFDTGWGLIQADRALAAVANISIAGTVFNDTNFNGVQDSGELAMPGTTVFMDSNSNGLLDSGTVTKSSTDVPKAITDATALGKPSRVVSTQAVSGLAGRITKVTVQLSVTHAYDADLLVSLISPSGIRVQLFAVVGGSGVNFTNTVLDDAAATGIATGVAPFTGTYKPASQLAALVGDDPNGLWQLELRDTYPADAGTLTAWSMNISTAETSQTTNAAGAYQFANLPLSAYYGSYRPTVVLAPGYVITAPATPYNYSLGSGQNVTGADIGLATNSTTKVTNVTSNVPDYTYGTGSVIPIRLTFNDQVTVTGTPTLVLNSGGSASYFAGSGTNTLIFTYTVGAGQASPDLDYASSFALAGTIKDSANIPINYQLPAPAATGSLGYNKNIVIDTSLPTSSISGWVYDVDTNTGLSHLRVYNDVNGNGKFDGSLITKTSTGAGVRVLDLKTVTKTLTVSGISLPIYGLTVSVNMTHSHLSDVVVTLISPAGTRVRLLNRQGNDGQNLKNTTFDDSADTLLPNSLLNYTATYQPTDALSAFNGQTANGIWTLEVTDNAIGDVGTLASFGLNITSTSEPNVFTNSAGIYRFNNAAAGNWKVRVDLTSNPTWTVNSPFSGQINYTLPTGGAVSGLNFGIKRPALAGAARMGVKLGNAVTTNYAVPPQAPAINATTKPRARRPIA